MPNFSDIGSAVWSWLLDKGWGYVLAGVVAVITLLKKWAEARFGKWIDSFVLGLKAAALVGVIGVCIQLVRVLPQASEATSAETAESKVQTWALNFGFGMAKQANPEAIWMYSATLTNGRKVVVFRPKSKPNFIVVTATVLLDNDQKRTLEDLSDVDFERVRRQTAFNLARQRIGFTFNVSLNDGKRQIAPIVLETRRPVEGMTEESFLEAIDIIDASIMMVSYSVALSADFPCQVRHNLQCIELAELLVRMSKTQRNKLYRSPKRTDYTGY